MSLWRHDAYQFDFVTWYNSVTLVTTGWLKADFVSAVKGFQNGLYSIAIG